MSRPILKLPNKPATTRAAGDSAVFRKPVRQGLKMAKRTMIRDGSAPEVDEMRSGRPAASPKVGKALTAADSRSSRPAVAIGETKSRGLTKGERSGSMIADRRQKAVPDRRQTTEVDRLASPVGRRTNVNDSPGNEHPERSTNRQPAVPSGRVHPPRGIARSTGVRASPPASRVATAALPQRLAGPASPPISASPVSEVPTPLVNAQPARGPAKELPRLAKRVCELTGCSRREADEWLENGWIRVDGIVVDRLGARVSPKARIEIAEAAKRHPATGVTVVYHQPSAASAASAGPCAALPLSSDNRWTDDPPGRPLPSSLLRRLSPVGRLAADECGMQVFTEQGGVARRLTDARVESEFHVRIDRPPTAEGLEGLRNGLRIDGLRLKCTQVSLSSDLLLRMVLRESRVGQITAMCRQLGLQALEIKRVRIGSVALGKLPVGRWRLLRPDERF